MIVICSFLALSKFNEGSKAGFLFPINQFNLQIVYFFFLTSTVVFDTINKIDNN